MEKKPCMGAWSQSCSSSGRCCAGSSPAVPCPCSAAALLVQEGLIRPSSPGAESAIRAAPDDALFQPPLLKQSCLATARQGGGSWLLPTTSLHQNPPTVCLSSTAAGSTGGVTHDENRCCSSSAGAWADTNCAGFL